MIKGFIDRIEGEWVILSLDDVGEMTFPRASMPADATEGSAVIVTVSLDHAATTAMKNDVRSIQDRLRNRG